MLEDYNPFSLENKKILVTGASSGIGRATAIQCSKLGAKLIITARNIERLKETFSLLKGDGHEMIVADLTNEESLNGLVDQICLIDGIVNNAGIVSTLPMAFINEKKIQEVLSVNFTAPIVLFSMLVKNRKIKDNSSVVFVSSINGTVVGIPGSSLYSGSKGGISGFVKTAAIENAKRRIRVNCICPGMIKTNLMKSSYITEEQLELDMKKYPLGRYGTPDEVAFGIIYLLSDASTFVTGTNLVIDGGFSII